MVKIRIVGSNLYVQNDGSLVKEVFNEVDASKVKRVVVKEGVTELGTMLFTDFGNIESITLPESLKVIQGMCFSNCYSLKEIKIPDSVSFIGSRVFSSCLALEKVELPSSLKKLYKETFYNCPNLSEILMKEGLNEVDGSSFSNLPSLKSLIFPSSVSLIIQGAISTCENMEEIEVGKGIKDINPLIYGLKDKVKEIRVREDSPYYEGKNGLVYSKGKNTLYFISPTKESAYIEDDVKEIGEYAFFNVKNLKSLSVPSSLDLTKYEKQLGKVAVIRR